MKKSTNIKIFESKKIRSVWNDKEEKWYFSIVDIVAVLTDQANFSLARNYWKVLKHRLLKEGSQLVTNCNQLKIQASDGKFYNTDVADLQTVFRLIQSIPSPKAEPFKLWLAKVGAERIDEIEDPEIGIERLMETYLRKGYSKEWVNQRLKSIEVRKELTNEWENRGVKKGEEFAILTDEITEAWSEFTTKQYRNFKGLKKQNLRDNMTNLELVLNMLAEATTTEISKEKQPKNFSENRKIARQGGAIAGNTRKAIERKTGKKIVSSLNVKHLQISNES
ncbi:MAG: antirepressor [Alphaproteobacteria bacterium RIFCSPLOWO2_01_FULL_40_26]|nr:MAG: antirepressor [Alphaproteobacteria bacterium RIFCSPHIGHO2_02_FULL_40_34]OFW94040.1 MAG: antirepressor [Alphaproteobacteria bacterium RIFCSPLOWO2_01_FULL_40_26]OFX09575.1 MAG: antirepressor [Alphaproteobacteria bacterium RIFCSPLOWO2_02_FULL_40_19]OFX12031.1 MAG: antirepressor [Alphaproteobacteria bacterium RIFCSPLOWO2_12_FULL_40_11]